MKFVNNLLYIHAFSLALIIGIFFFVFYKKRKKELFLHMTELWFSLAVSIAATFYFRYSETLWSFVGLFLWIWPVKNISRLIHDFVRTRIPYQFNTMALSVGMFLSVCLMFYDIPLQYCIMPFFVSLLGVVSSLLYTAFRKFKKNPQSTLVNFTLVGLGLTIFMFPALIFIKGEEATTYLISLEVLALVMVSMSTFSLSLLSTDVQDQRTLSKTLNVRNHQILALSELNDQSALCAGLTHELSGPLTVLQAKLTLAMRKKNEMVEASGVKGMLFQVQRMIRAIENVRELMNREDKDKEEKLDIQDIVKNVLGLVAQRYSNHGIQLRVYGNVNGSIFGNKVQLEQALLHVLHNSFEAVEYLGDKWIEISMLAKEDYYQIFIKDSGLGIPEEIRAEMMKPLFTTKLSKSLGMGLNTTYRIVQNHGGEFYYLDQKNTTFVMELPRAKTKPMNSHFRESTGFA